VFSKEHKHGQLQSIGYFLITWQDKNNLAGQEIQLKQQGLEPEKEASLNIKVEKVYGKGKKKTAGESKRNT
jgi:hypothetical protein